MDKEDIIRIVRKNTKPNINYSFYIDENEKQISIRW